MQDSTKPLEESAEEPAGEDKAASVETAPIESVDSHETPSVEPPAADEPAPSDEIAPDHTEPADPTIQKPTVKGRWKSFWHRYWRKKPLTLPLTVLVLLGVILTVPFTRYPVLGTFLQESFKVVVLDKSSNTPVSNAVVTLKGKTVKTDAKGLATLKVKVGNGNLAAAKKYYKSASVTALVPLKQKDAYKVYIVATGRQVPVVVVNKISGKPVANALLTAAGTEAKTDKDGKAIIVLPAGNKTADIKVKLTGYNDLSGTVVVTEQTDKANTFAVTPAGKIYFLSKLSGKIDVVKTDLDGSNRQTVLAGTGKEDGVDTILLASRDWKYLVLKSKRDGGDNAKLFLIDTTNSDKLTTMDEGNAYFTLVGWSDHHFVYQVSRNGYNNWQPKAQALKIYDAEAGKIAVIDETDASGTGPYDYAYNQFGSIYILDNELVYYKNWAGNNYSGNELDGKSVSVISVKPDGSGKHTVKDFPAPSHSLYTYAYYSIQARLYEPQGIYFQVPLTDGSNKNVYYEYEDAKITAKSDVTDQQFNDAYPTYLVSPSGKQTFWTDSRDGKNVLFVGDADAKSEKQIATLSDYSNYGWYSDDYLLVTKNSSELSIMPAAGGVPIKISDYHKPAYNFSGYGGGYGGL